MTTQKAKKIVEPIKMADPQTTRLADLKQGQYHDGSPLDDIQYLECKADPEDR